MKTVEAKQAADEAAAQKKREELIFFCSRCFASEDNASWGGEVVEYMCSNCGAGGPNLRIPRWAVEGIRSSASWVGKRYYPADEDHEHYSEVRALRDLVKVFPGRSARLGEDGTFWWVEQLLSGGCSTTSTTVELSKAKTAAEAMELVRLDLPYVSQEQLKKAKKKS